MTLTCGSLFAGIGGFDLGFERAGIKTIWQVEIDEYCRRVLAKHFPDAERFGDIGECGGCGQFRKETPHRLRAVDVIAGGFPCQDISIAGNRAGINGQKSGLWTEMLRIICEVRPRIVVVENVSALLNRGMGRVLGDLAACGYDAEWDCLPASAVGAPHRRDRAWIVANTNSGRCEQRFQAERSIPEPDESSAAIQNPIFAGLEGYERGILALANYRRHNSDPSGSGWWSTEPGVGRVANGISGRVAPLRALGNALVPQIAEWIGRRIIEAEEKVYRPQST